MHEQVVHAAGHEHVSGTHGSTLELTTEEFLTPAGDCILGIGADCAPATFDPEFVSACQDAAATVSLRLRAGSHTDTVRGRGDPDLEFSDEGSLVVRTSEYIDGRTVMVGADRAAAGIDRELVGALADGATLRARLRVE